MSLFGKKRTVPEKTGAVQGASRGDSQRAVTHRVTLDLSRAETLAAMLASSRASKFIEISDLLAGLYMYEWERLAAYWPAEKREDVEEMMREICRISPARWNYWIQRYDAMRKDDDALQRWPQMPWQKDAAATDAPPEPSARLRAVFEAAARISPFRDPGDGNSPPVLTSECVLLCIAKYVTSETGRKLCESGLDLDLLERATLDPKRSPLR